jgi:hypothetical protein
MTDEQIVSEVYAEMMEKIWIKTKDKDKYENLKRLIRETAELTLTKKEKELK